MRIILGSLLMVLSLSAFASETLSGEAAAGAYRVLPGPVKELSPTVHQKTSADGQVVCTRTDRMLGETDYDCTINEAAERE